MNEPDRPEVPDSPDEGGHEGERAFQPVPEWVLSGLTDAELAGAMAAFVALRDGETAREYPRLGVLWSELLCHLDDERRHRARLRYRTEGTWGTKL